MKRKIYGYLNLYRIWTVWEKWTVESCRILQNKKNSTSSHMTTKIQLYLDIKSFVVYDAYGLINSSALTKLTFTL